MNERALKAKLRLLLKPHCYIQSMSSYATNGTPDLWISGNRADLWLEVKYDDKTKGSIKPKLSPLQSKWLNDRYVEGRNVAVFVGTSPTGGLWYDDDNWNTHRDNLHRMTLAEVITHITSLVNHTKGQLV